MAQKWFQLLHAYASMAALLVVLFFGATGITLNHPEWDLGLDATQSSVSADIPASAIAADGSVELLALSEDLRQEYDVSGDVSDFGVTDDGGYISYRGPGYSADVTFDTTAGTFTLETERQGVIGVLNDLHKGRGTTGSWRWLIDVSGAFLVAIALTGLGLQLVLRRRRTTALVVAGVGALVTLVVGVLTLA